MKRIDAERARQLAWIAMGAYVVALGISATIRTQGDFNVYYRAGHRMLRGMAIYPADDSDRFLYAPIFAIAFAPLAALPRHLAQFFFFIINALGLVEFVLVAGVLLFGRERRLSASLIVVPVLVSFRFIGNNIEHGQINLPTLALIAWAIIHAEESRNRSAGLMLATACLIKPFAVLAASWLLIRGHLAALGWTAIAGAALILAPIVVFGPHGWVDQTEAYVRAIMSMTDRYQTMLTNQSAVAAVARLATGYGPSMAAVAGIALEAILVGAVCWWDFVAREGRGMSSRLALCAMFCLMASIAPISWKSYYASMLIAYMALVAALWTDRAEDASYPKLGWVLFATSVALNLAPGNYLNRLALFYSAHFVSSMVAIAALFSVRRIADSAPSGQR